MLGMLLRMHRGPGAWPPCPCHAPRSTHVGRAQHPRASSSHATLRSPHGHVFYGLEAASGSNGNEHLQRRIGHLLVQRSALAETVPIEFWALLQRAQQQALPALRHVPGPARSGVTLEAAPPPTTTTTKKKHTHHTTTTTPTPSQTPVSSPRPCSLPASSVMGNDGV